MLKIQVHPAGDVFEVDILENDRGNWEVRDGVDQVEVGCFHLVGFDAENTITVHVSHMQDGTTSIVVVHNVVDNPIVVKQALAPRRMRFEEDYYTQMNIHINQLLTEVCDYPETINDARQRMGLESL